MSVIIKPKRSLDPSRNPGSEDLEIGEIALNIAPGSEALFVKNTSGEVKNLTGSSLRYTKIKETSEL